MGLWSWESTTSLIASPAQTWWLQLTFLVTTSFCFLMLNGIQWCPVLQGQWEVLLLDTLYSTESKVSSFSHPVLAEMGKWHGVTIAGKLCRLGGMICMESFLSFIAKKHPCYRNAAVYGFPLLQRQIFKAEP